MLKIATWDDYDHIISMSESFAHNSPYEGIISVDTNKIAKVIRGILDGDKSQSIIILYLKDEVPVGMIIGSASETNISFDKMAHELIWWIEPEHRGGRAAIELFQAFEFWAKKVGCTLVQVSLVETEHAPKVEKIYSRFGYRQTERAFFKEL